MTLRSSIRSCIRTTTSTHAIRTDQRSQRFRLLVSLRRGEGLQRWKQKFLSKCIPRWSTIPQRPLHPAVANCRVPKPLERDKALVPRNAGRGKPPNALLQLRLLPLKRRLPAMVRRQSTRPATLLAERSITVFISLLSKKKLLQALLAIPLSPGGPISALTGQHPHAPARRTPGLNSVALTPPSLLILLIRATAMIQLQSMGPQRSTSMLMGNSLLPSHRSLRLIKHPRR